MNALAAQDNPSRSRIADPGESRPNQDAVMYSDGEQFLLSFHGEQPGVTEQVFTRIPARLGEREFSSSYAALAEVVPAGAQIVLDLGCGSAPMRSALAAANHPCTYIGVDFSADELRLAPRHSFLIAARSQAIPLMDGSVGAIVSHMALMLMGETPRVVREIARVLRRGGSLAAILPAPRPPTPAFDAYVQLLRRELDVLAKAAPRLGGGGWRDPGMIATTLGAEFQNLEFELLELEERLTASAAWDSFLKMYDLFLLDANARERIRAEWMERCSAWQAPDRRITFPLRLLRLHCTRA